MRDGILKHTGEVEPETLEGKIVRIVDRVAYINHDIDDAIRHDILSVDDLPAGRGRAARPDAARSASTRSSTISSRSSAAAGDIVQSEDVGSAMLSLRSFMFERVYLGPHTTRGARARARDDPADLRQPRRAGRLAGRDRGLSLGHDRPLRPRVRGRPLVARIKDTSVEAVKAAANIVDLVEARTRLRKVGGRYTGLCPFHQEKTPSFSVSPDRGHVLLLRLRRGRGRDLVRARDRGARLRRRDRMARRPLLGRRSSTRTRRPRPTRSASARSGCYALLDQAATFYERVLWAESGKAVQEYLASRGLSEEACREFRLGLSLRRLARKEGAREGLHGRGAARRGPAHEARRRLLPAATDVSARGRALRA